MENQEYRGKLNKLIERAEVVVSSYEELIIKAETPEIKQALQERKDSFVGQFHGDLMNMESQFMGKGEDPT